MGVLRDLAAVDDAEPSVGALGAEGVHGSVAHFLALRGVGALGRLLVQGTHAVFEAAVHAVGGGTGTSERFGWVGAVAVGALDRVLLDRLLTQAALPLLDVSILLSFKLPLDLMHVSLAEELGFGDKLGA